jgi:hypothetical protein
MPRVVEEMGREEKVTYDGVAEVAKRLKGSPWHLARARPKPLDP